MKMNRNEMEALYAFGCPNLKATVERLRMVAALAPDPVAKKLFYMLTKEEYASYKAKYTKQAEDIRESVRVLKEKLTEVLENRSERNRWISQFTQFSTLETLDRKALIHMVQSIRVRGKKELDITFTHEDEYKKALQLLALAAQQKDYEQRKVG